MAIHWFTLQIQTGDWRQVLGMQSRSPAWVTGVAAWVAVTGAVITASQGLPGRKLEARTSQELNPGSPRGTWASSLPG